MRLIDADALLEHQVEADKMGAMLVVGKGFIMDAPTITPQPDPDTGLVPCGCGGRARLYELDDDFYLVRVECSQCYVATRATYNEERATHDWNRAMGWKGGAK